MSSQVVYENFSELPIGSTTTPVGWTNSFGQFLVVQAPPNRGDSVNAARFFSSFVYDSEITVNDNTFYFGFAIDIGNNGPGPLIQLQAQENITNLPRTVLSINIEADRSLTMQIGGHLIDNSANPIHKPTDFVPFYAENGPWYFCQLNITCSVAGDPEGTISYKDLALVVNGDTVLSGIDDPSTFVSNGPNGVSGGFRFISFSSGGGFMFIREISWIEPHNDTGVYPHPLIPPLYVQGLVSQGVMEVSGPSVVNNARVSQGVIEYAKNEKFNNARISQAVIEVLTKKGLPSGGWRVKEV